MELIYESVEECIQAELEIRSMERLQAQIRKINPEDKFTDLPLDLFKRICLRTKNKIGKDILI